MDTLDLIEHIKFLEVRRKDHSSNEWEAKGYREACRDIVKYLKEEERGKWFKFKKEILND